MEEYILDIIQSGVQGTTGVPLPNENKPDIAEDQLSSNYTSSGATEIGTPIISLSASNIINKLSDKLQTIKSTPMRELFLKLFLSIQNHLIGHPTQHNESSHFPPIHIKIIEDDSILIEWIFSGFRIGFSIEPEINQSCWLMLSNDNLENVSGSGFFSIENVDLIVDELFNFIFSNT